MAFGLFGIKGGGPNPVPEGLVGYWDAGNWNCTNPSLFTSVKNLEATPADSSSQATYDLTALLATFNGTYGALTSNEYFSLFSAPIASNTTFTNSLHKDNAAFTIEMWMANGGTAEDAMYTTSSTDGIIFKSDGPNSRISFQCGNGSGGGAKNITSSTFTMSVPHQIVLAYDEAGTYQFYLNGSTLGSAASGAYSSPSTNAASVAFHVGSGGASMKYYIWRIYNTKLDAAQVAQNFRADRFRFGL